MSDAPLVREQLRQLLETLSTVLERFQPVRSVEDLAATAAGREKLDALCMQLIVLGEGLKNLEKITAGTLLPRYPGVDWRKAGPARLPEPPLSGC